MIDIYAPLSEQILAIQERETAFYWSNCTDALLRKHGLVSGRYRMPGDPPTGCAIVLRENEPQFPIGNGPIVLEGPVSDKVLGELGLVAKTERCENARWYDGARRFIAELCYSEFSVKRIASAPNSSCKPKPYTYRDPDARWNNRRFGVQRFEVSGEWRVVAFAQIGESEEHVPVAVTDGRRLVLGAPLFDLAIAPHAMPALPDGFYANVTYRYLFNLERWLIDQMLELAGQNDVAIPKVPVWPNGARAAFTIRHDYDRPISDERLTEILSFYRSRGIRATWFLLVNKMPSAGQIAAMLAEGHEIALHTEASDFQTFREEVGRFRETTGVMPQGYTCHGGIGSSGQLALAQYLWAETVGMLYGEMIGRKRGLPHPVIKPECGIPVARQLIIQDSHFSFDAGTAPEAHRLEMLAASIPGHILNGGHIVVMNHPDLHWAELASLIDRLDLVDSWCCTMEEAARWARANQFSTSIQWPDRRCSQFPADLERLAARPRMKSGASRQVTLTERPPAASCISPSPATETMPDSTQIFDFLRREIENWFAKHGGSTPGAVAGTIRMNTVDVPKRLDYLLRPISRHLDASRPLEILDVGCGYGAISLGLAQRFPQAQVVATDLNARFYAAGQNCADALGLKRVVFRSESILSLSDESRFDLVVLSNMLNYLTTAADLRQGCRNAIRATKPGGWIVVHTPHAWSIVEPFTNVPLLHVLPIGLRGRVSRYLGKRSSFHDIRLPSYLELRRHFMRNGGQIITTRPNIGPDLLLRRHLSLWIRKGVSGD